MWSIGRLVNEVYRRGWSSGRKSNESMGVRPAAFIRWDAARRLRMM